MNHSQKYLIQELITSGILKNPRIISAFEKVDRADFVLAEDRGKAHENYPLFIGLGQTISQPTTVALMFELLNPKPGNTVLDIGSGSGWTTTLLSHIVGSTGSVIGVERLQELVIVGQKNLAKYPSRNASIIQAKKKLGLPGKVFDRILVSAGASEFPMELLDQLKPKGRLVLPVGISIFLYEKDAKGTIRTTEFPGFSFVPLKNASDFL